MGEIEKEKDVHNVSANLTVTNIELDAILNDRDVKVMPLSSTEVQAKMEDLEEETIDTIQSGDTVAKNEIVQRAREMMKKANGVPADKESQISNMLGWASTYISDAFPLATAVLTNYLTLVFLTDDYVETEECDFMYQAIRWGIFVLSFAYLTLMGWKGSTETTFGGFFRSFWLNWVVFVLLVMVMAALPPLGCYAAYPAIITVSGVLGLALLAAGMYLREQKLERKAAAEDMKVRMSRLVVAEYAGWNWQECLVWVMSLENGRFQKYEELLRVALSASDATGKELGEVTSLMLKVAIKDGDDRTAVVAHIRDLVQNGNVEEVEVAVTSPDDTGPVVVHEMLRNDSCSGASAKL